MSSDVTRALKSTELERALEQAGDGVMVVGSGGRIALWNPAAEKILGYSARDVLGKPCCEILAGRDEHDNRLCYQGCHVMTLVKLGEAVRSFDMQLQTKRGDSVWINISILALPNGRPGDSVAVYLFRDVTAAHGILGVVRERQTSAAPPPAASEIGETLTRRETEILKLMAAGLNTRDTAERLHVSPATVRNHVQNIFTKLEVHSRLEVVALATRRRWL
jgi:PAS domain S-box-containing protein